MVCWILQCSWSAYVRRPAIKSQILLGCVYDLNTLILNWEKAWEKLDIWEKFISFKVIVNKIWIVFSITHLSYIKRCANLAPKPSNVSRCLTFVFGGCFRKTTSSDVKIFSVVTFKQENDSIPPLWNLLLSLHIAFYTML